MSNLSVAPALEVTCLNTASAVGLLQMLPRQTKSTLVLPASPAMAITRGGDEGAERCSCRALIAAAEELPVANVLVPPRMETKRGDVDPACMEGGGAGCKGNHEGGAVRNEMNASVPHEHRGA